MLQPVYSVGKRNLLDIYSLIVLLLGKPGREFQKCWALRLVGTMNRLQNVASLINVLALSM
jgi:hypothetical protein